MTLTPEQFDKLTTKEDSNRLEAKVDSIVSNVSQLLGAVDGLAKDVKDMKDEFVSNQAAHDRFEERITKTEDQLHLRPVLEKV